MITHAYFFLEVHIGTPNRYMLLNASPNINFKGENTAVFYSQVFLGPSFDAFFRLGKENNNFHRGVCKKRDPESFAPARRKKRKKKEKDPQMMKMLGKLAHH